MNNNKKKINIIIGLIVVLLVVLAATSYAVWQITRKQTNKNRVVTACLNITYEEETGSDIRIEKMWPMDDDDGAEASEPYVFRITNECDEPVNYTVALEAIKDSTLPNDSDYLNPEYIKVMLNATEPVKYGTLEEMTNDTESSYTVLQTRKIVSRQLRANETQKYMLKLWLDENTPLKESDGTKNTNKYFFGKIKVTAGPSIERECFAVNSDGIIYDYDYDCGTNPAIPTTVNGVRVKGVSSSAFYTIDLPPVSAMEEGDTDISHKYFSLAVSKEWVLAMFNEVSYTPTAEDAWFIVYKNGENDHTMDAIEKGKVDGDMISDIKEMLESAGADINDCAIYIDGEDQYIRGGEEVYFSVVENTETEPTSYDSEAIGYYYSPEVVAALMGGGEQPELLSDAEMIAETIDFSGATYLETIERDAFSSYSPDLLVLPDSVKVIERNAFRSYRGNNATLTMPSSLEEVGYSAFYNFSGDLLELNEGLNSIGEFTFYYYNGSDLVLPSTLKSIGLQAFDKYAGVGNSLTIPSSINLIENQAFESYAGDELIIEDGVRVIGNQVFYNFNGTLDLGNDIKSIGDNCFNYYNQPTLSLPASLEQIGSGAFINYVGTNQPLVLPSNLTKIGRNAFSAFKGTTITIPGTLETISSFAFSGYEGANQTLTIPNGVKVVGDDAFYRFNGSGISLAEGVKSIGEAAFYQYVGSGTTLTMPSSLKSIGSNAFFSFAGSNLVLNEGLETIDDYAFRNGYSGTGTTLTIPSTVKKIGASAFGHFTGDNLIFNGGPTTIGSYAFVAYDGYGKSLIIPEGTESIDDNAFNNFKGSSLSLPEGLVSIGTSAFIQYGDLYQYSGAADIEIPTTVMTIESSAFGGFWGTIRVHSKALYDSRASWAPHATVVLV